MASDKPGFTQGFYLRRREDGFWLRGYKASLDYLWDPTDRFIFVKSGAEIRTYITVDFDPERC